MLVKIPWEHTIHCSGGLACKTCTNSEGHHRHDLGLPQLCAHPRHSLDPQSLAQGLAYGTLLVSIHWIISNLLLLPNHKTGTSKTLGFGEPSIKSGLLAKIPPSAGLSPRSKQIKFFQFTEWYRCCWQRPFLLDRLPKFIKPGELATN